MAKEFCKHSPFLPEVQLKKVICKLLGMDSFNELIVAEFIDSILIKEDRTLELEY